MRVYIPRRGDRFVLTGEWKVAGHRANLPLTLPPGTTLELRSLIQQHLRGEDNIALKVLTCPVQTYCNLGFTATENQINEGRLKVLDRPQVFG